MISIKETLYKGLHHTQFMMLTFFIIQLLILIFSGFSACDDFTYFYLPNAQNFVLDQSFQTYDHQTVVPNGELYRFGHMPPVYILFTSLFVIFKQYEVILFLANTLIIIASLLVFKKVFSKITSNNHIISISLWIMVFNPMIINIPRQFLSEGLFMLFVALGLYYMIKFIQESKWLFLLISIISFILSIETRSINTYIFLLIIIPVLLSKLKPLTKTIAIITMVTVHICIVNFNQTADQKYYLKRTLRDGLKRFRTNESAIKLIDAINNKSNLWTINFKDEFKNQLKENPSELITLYLSKYIKSWYATDSGEHEKILLLINIPFLITWLISLFLLLIKRVRKLIYSPEFVLLFLFVFYTNIVSTATLSICRYMTPIAPLYIFIGVYIINLLIKQYKNRLSVSPAI